MPVDPVRLEEVFLAAAAIPVTERSAYLQGACGPDRELRAAVERLLAAHADPASILKRTVAPLPLTDAHTLQPDAGTLLAGRYTLLEEIGEGGMGTVWMARQSEPVKRTVAVKLIKPGMDSRAVLARFEAERQALALMDHPNIARVLDGGLTADGRPFFVMDLVKGIPITQFCDAKRLTPRERLELFVPVCQAIQHAHQKGIIHRDIKPSNVLVALYDDRPVPKVIDFGVAKATGQPLTEQTFHTGFGTVIGTPQYMSPEQATFNNLDVDTRSDLYSLGVLLYELLAGSPPFTKKDLEQAGMLEMLRVVREVEPPRPSTKLSTAHTLPSLAANRSTEPKKLTGMLRNELDWIVMKALEKDRTRRYETANGFAADVLRYLSGEPVLAVPPSVGYRLQKVLRKNRGPVIAVMTVALVFVLGAAGTVAGLLWAERARTAVAQQKLKTQEQEAARASAEAEILRKEQADDQRRLRNRDATLALMTQVEIALLSSDAKTAGEAFEQTEKRIAEGGVNDLKSRLERCRTELAMLRELDRIDADRWSIVEGELASWGSAVPHWIKAFSQYGIIPGKTSDDVAVLKINSSLIRERLLTSLELWFVQSGRTMRLERVLAMADPDEFRNEARAKSYSRALLAWAFRGKSVPTTQPVWFAIGHGTDRTVKTGLREQLLMTVHRLRANSFPVLMELASTGDGSKKEMGLRFAGWYRAALALQPANPVAWNNLGLALKDAGEPVGAVAACKEAIRLDPNFAPARTNLGVVLGTAGDLLGSIAACEEALRLDPNVAVRHSNLGAALKNVGNMPGAIAACKEAIRLDPHLATAHNNLGIALYHSGDLPGAIAACKEALRLDPTVASSHSNLGVALKDSGDLPGAIAAHKEAIRLDPKLGSSHSNLGIALRASGDLQGAIAAYREAIRLDPTVSVRHNNLGNALHESGDLPGAIASFKEAVRLNPNFALGYRNLGNTLQASGDRVGAIAAYREALRLDPKNAEYHSKLGECLNETGDLTGAKAALKEAIRFDARNAQSYNTKLAVIQSNLGNSLYNSGDLPGAVKAYKEAVQLDPKNAQTYFWLGSTMNQLGLDEQGAVAALRAAIRLNPDHVEAHFSLGKSLNNMGDLRAAVGSYKDVIRLDPKHALAHYGLGNVLKHMGHVSDAISSYRESIRLDPSFAMAHNNLGIALSDSGNPVEAIVSFKESIRLDPKLAPTHLNLGAALRASGDLRGAIESFKEAIRLDPNFAPAHYSLGLALHFSGDLPGAVASSKEAVRINPRDAAAHSSLSLFYTQQKKYPDAIVSAREAIRLDPKCTNAYAVLGLAFQETGDIAGAREAWTEAARLDPKRYGPLLAKLPPIPLAPPPHEVNAPPPKGGGFE